MTDYDLDFTPVDHDVVTFVPIDVTSLDESSDDLEALVTELEVGQARVRAEPLSALDVMAVGAIAAIAPGDVSTAR